MFIESPDGGVDFGYLPEDVSKIIRRQAGPIRLLESDLRHIEERHGDQIRQAGYPSIENFVRSIAVDYNRIYAAKAGSMAILVHKIGRERFAIIRLQPAKEQGDTDFYAVKTASLCRPDYLLNRNLLLEQDGPILSLVRDPFDPGTEVDVYNHNHGNLNVKRQRLSELSADTERFHPPPGGTLPSTHEQRFLSFITQEYQNMATQPEPIFSHGPLSIVASDDEQKPGITILHDEWDNGEFVSQDDPLHKEFLNLIQKNKNSLGFVANQIQARMEQVGRWAGLSLEDEGVTFGPARGVQEIEAQQPKPEEEIAPPAEVQAKKEASVEHEQPASTESSEKAAKPQEPEKAKEEEKQNEIPPAEPAKSAAPDPSERPINPKEAEKENADILQSWPDGATDKGQKAEEKQKTFVHLETPVTLLSHNKKPLVLDYGDQITVTNRALFGIGREAQKKRENAVGTALSAAVERFGEPVHVVGNKAFLKQTAEMAVKMGIQLEPGDEQARKIYQEALDRAAKEKGNVLSPARNPSKTKEQDLGYER